MNILYTFSGLTHRLLKELESTLHRQQALPNKWQ